MRNSYVIALMALIAGCASNPSPVQLSPGTYLISREDKGGIFGNPSALKAAVISDANAFAASKGKVAIPISTHETPSYPLHFASFDYQFKLVDRDSAEAKSTALAPTPNVRVDQHGTTTVDVHSDPVTKKDVYAELVKLDDLHKKGILTDAEFESQKKKLLESN
jgi:hypothetical protein